MADRQARVALVTGASRGIGAATAVQLAAKGYAVVVNYCSNQAAAEDVVARIENAGGLAHAIAADVADENSVEALFEHVDQNFGRLDALVNNAGILLPQMRLEEMTAERINHILVTNVSSCLLCSREAIKRMSSKHAGSGGAIVNVSSAAARLGAPNEYVDYAASKGAIDSLTTGLALELAGDNIRVNAVRPGYIHTDMHADGGEPDRINRIRQSIPMQRGGQPEEVASAIAFLLSDEASYITGSFIDLAGGK